MAALANACSRSAGKACLSALPAAGMALADQKAAQAVEFQAKGQWLVGFALGNAASSRRTMPTTN
ncbi:MAG: hypothetical protein IK061_10740 [Desulfovibrio sp.]|nr:hypothetical protein [Desulfovibrio sp.]